MQMMAYHHGLSGVVTYIAARGAYQEVSSAGLITVALVVIAGVWGYRALRRRGGRP